MNYDFDLQANTVKQLQQIDGKLENKCIAAKMVCVYKIFILYIKIESILLKHFILL